MTIQISVLIWTILSFIALAFILNNLLFKPVLEVMDKRKQKIAESRAMRQALVDERQKEISALNEQHIEEQKAAIARSEQSIGEEKEKTSKIIDDQKDTYDSLLAEQRKKLDIEMLDIEKELTSRIDALAVDYAKRIVQ